MLESIGLGSVAVLPLWIRIAVPVFAAGLFLAYYQERRDAGDATLIAAGKTVIASPMALYKYVVWLFAKTATATTKS